MRQRHIIIYIQQLLPICVLSLSLWGCKTERRYFPSDEQMQAQHIEIVRFDSALLSEGFHPSISRLATQYPQFMPLFTEDILGIPFSDTAYLNEALPQFLSDTVYGFAETNAAEQATFADITDIQADIDRAFTRIHYLYPDWEMPTIYFFISGFNASIYFADDIIAVGADMYLGSDYKYYNRVVHDYQKYTMRKECIAADVVSAYLFRNIPYTSQKNRLLEQMLYRGKVIYLLAQLFPNLPAHEVMGYKKEQWDWCVDHEKAIWHLIMDKRDLFKAEPLLLSSYLNDGPFTAEVSQDSPGRLGTWVGWRIVESYMAHNEQVTLQALMEEGDAQYILEQSHYQP